MDELGLELCSRHKKRLDRLIRRNNTPVAAIQLYYGLKAAGASPMLEWWDGDRFIDIAFSRVKLNIEIDNQYEQLTVEQLVSNLEKDMQADYNGFTTIRIPQLLVQNSFNQIVENLLGIVEGLRANVRLI